jgi:hypothetical protein
MPDRAKFAEMVERRMAQYDETLRRMEPLARNYDHNSQDVQEMIRYMRTGIDKLESLFTSGGKIGGFRLKPLIQEEETPPTDTSNTPVKLSSRKA